MHARLVLMRAPPKALIKRHDDMHGSSSVHGLSELFRRCSAPAGDFGIMTNCYCGYIDAVALQLVSDATIVLQDRILCYER
jgi:hypothetical protein